MVERLFFLFLLVFGFFSLNQADEESYQEQKVSIFTYQFDVTYSLEVANCSTSSHTFFNFRFSDFSDFLFISDFLIYFRFILLQLFIFKVHDYFQFYSLFFHFHP